MRFLSKKRRKSSEPHNNMYPTKVMKKFNLNKKNFCVKKFGAKS